MKKVRLILTIVFIVFFLSTIYFWASRPLGGSKALGYIYYISPYYSNSTTSDISGEELGNSLPSKYVVVDYDNISNSLPQKYIITDYNKTYRNEILLRYKYHNLTNGKPYPHPTPPEDFKVLYQIFSNESYVIGGISVIYDFHFLLLEYPNGSIVYFTVAESYPVKRVSKTDLQDIDHSNHKEYKKILSTKAENDFQTICNMIFKIDIDVTNLLIPYYYV